MNVPPKASPPSVKNRHNDAANSEGSPRRSRVHPRGKRRQGGSPEDDDQEAGKRAKYTMLSLDDGSTPIIASDKRRVLSRQPPDEASAAMEMCLYAQEEEGDKAELIGRLPTALGKSFKSSHPASKYRPSSVLLVFPTASKEDIEEEEKSGIHHQYLPSFMLKPMMTREDSTKRDELDLPEVGSDKLRCAVEQMPLEDLKDLQLQVEHYRKAFEYIALDRARRGLSLEAPIRADMDDIHTEVGSVTGSGILGIDVASKADVNANSAEYDITPGAICLFIGTCGSVQWGYKPPNLTLRGVTVIPDPCKTIDDYEDHTEAATDVEAAYNIATRWSDLCIPDWTVGSIADKLGKLSTLLSEVVSDRKSHADPVSSLTT
jgi:hypothetical protein